MVSQASAPLLSGAGLRRPGGKPRIAVAHDWLVRLGGAERCLAEVLDAFPDARLLTTLTSGLATRGRFRRAEPSWLQRLPGATSHHEFFLPFMPLAWRLRPQLDDVDVVVASSYACANAVRIAASIPLLSYCHTPIRYAWSFQEERERFPKPMRLPAQVAMSALRRWDRNTATRVTLFVANSNAVADRIRRCYGRPARVVHPPVDTDFFFPAPRDRAGFLYVGRLTGYKRPELVVRAFDGLPYGLTVVGDGPLLGRLRTIAPPNVSFRQHVSVRELRELYRRSVAMVFPVNEDFGIAMAEAQACGTPVIGLAAGGALDIVEHERTGWLVDAQTPDAIRVAVQTAQSTPLDQSYIAQRARRFGRSRFRRELSDIVIALAEGASEAELL
jgi:glycosyltransferase involved in cell wall biosynthesis